MKVHPVFLMAFALSEWYVTLWNEPYAHRTLHHFQRMSYSSKREPLVVEVNISENHRRLLFELDHTSHQDACAEQLVGSSFLGGVQSRRCMKYYDMMEPEEKTTYQSVLKDIKPLQGYYLSNHSRDSMFVINYDTDGSFDWHYDNEDISCGRLLISEGDGMTFEYISSNGSIVSFTGNSSVFIRGTTTFHRARRIFSAPRRVFAFQLCDQSLPASPLTLCNTLASATLSQLASTFLPYVFGFRIAHKLTSRIDIDVPLWMVLHTLLIPLHRYSLRTMTIVLGFWLTHSGSLADSSLILVYLSIVDEHPLEKK